MHRKPAASDSQSRLAVLDAVRMRERGATTTHWRDGPRGAHLALNWAPAPLVLRPVRGRSSLPSYSGDCRLVQ